MTIRHRTSAWATTLPLAGLLAGLLAGVARAAPQEPALAATPPMGWNSWNCFQKDIDEQKIRAIADAMVSTGMRDAGYVYLVLDDAWMAKTRDASGRLRADPKKFPSGMKAIGDYIHSLGLKFGLYEDRGKLTCQQLPGSFQHEREDMATFAAWGVDYIKMDSCFAESNGRFSSEDYAIYRRRINATGRRIVLSISDFGNAAWAWGGRESAQLWRTSGDIYPWMGSVYHCAETSAGDQRIHPAFRGLWQFAGPGHWNDPDMLQVGNLKHIDPADKPRADRAHFSLWCILAAPLMAGNDLREVSADVVAVLTAPEVIAVDQDPRGVQGYKVAAGDGHEIYNKPLADGTTAVLLLNKGRKKSDIRVRWDQIGLRGVQPVRDLWARKDLGGFRDGFTAAGLLQHGHRLIKIGKPGPPLPLPATVAVDKYTVTQTGETSLCDLYYVWKGHHAPSYDRTVGGGPIAIGERKFARGFGVRGKSAFMFQTLDRADRFRAVVALDPAAKDGAKGRFRVQSEDFFARKILWDSGEMTERSAPASIDIALPGVQCLMLVFEGKDALGIWADPRVHASRRPPLGRDVQAANRIGGSPRGPKRVRGRHPAMQEAIERGLAWLRDHQDAAGGWGEMSGFALLAYLAHGSTHRSGPFRLEVARAIDAIERIGPERLRARPLLAAVSTWALAEAAVLSRDGSVGVLARQRLVRLAGQHDDRGRWKPAGSATGPSLFARRLAGLALVAGVELDCVEKAVAAAAEASIDRDRPDTLAPTIDTASWLWRNASRKVLRRFSGATVRTWVGVDRGRHQARSSLLFPATRAANHVGGNFWKQWLDSTLQAVIADQSKDGRDRGSWTGWQTPRETVDRRRATLMALLALESLYLHSR